MGSLGFAVVASPPIPKEPKDDEIESQFAWKSSLFPQAVAVPGACYWNSFTGFRGHICTLGKRPWPSLFVLSHGNRPGCSGVPVFPASNQARFKLAWCVYCFHWGGVFRVGYVALVNRGNIKWRNDSNSTGKHRSCLGRVRRAYFVPRAIEMDFLDWIGAGIDGRSDGFGY